jgi:hypothetical protein
MVGSPVKAPAFGQAVVDVTPGSHAGMVPWTTALDRFVRDEPARALQVLAHWMSDESDDGEPHDGRN